MSRDNKIIYIGVPVFAIALAAIFYYLGNQTPAAPVDKNANQRATLTYANSDFKISLQYPSSWKPSADKGGFKGVPLYLKGSDGFFGIDALGANANGAVSIDNVVKQLISNSSNPYGNTPSVTKPDTGKIESRLITPSLDQPPWKNGEAALIVRYPKPVAIGTDTFLFFMLYGDKGHLASIANTLQLMQ